MKTFQQFMSEAYSKSEKQSHNPPRSSFLGALDKQRKDAGRMAPMPQIGPGKGVPLYIPSYQGTRGEEDKNPSNFARQTNKSKVEKRYRTNMPIQSGRYKEPDNITL
tara:strand:+ start:9 stop:329 length:321 start_codon:yes stop_codon:yes gene_type:complete